VIAPRALLLLLLALIALSSCSSESEPPSAAHTAVRITPLFDPEWSLDQLELVSGERRAVVPEAPRPLEPGETVVLLLAPGDAGKMLEIAVWGLSSGERTAHGELRITPLSGQTIDVSVTLTRLACGVFCEPEATACRGDAVVTCQELPDGCREWGDPVACPSAEPYCSAGVCSATCSDECSEGDSRCADAAAIERCGEADSDSCLDWLPAEPCPGGEACDGGTCKPKGTCSDDCVIGQSRCEDTGLSTCGQHDADDCLDWGPRVDCPAGGRCVIGVCTPIDPCEGVTCGAPDPAECADLETLRTFAAPGTCNAGTCSYDHDDTTCLAGCTGGACVCVAGGWTGSTLAAGGEQSVMRFDAAGGLHVVYHDVTDTDLKYLYRPAGGTFATPVALDAGANEIGWYISLDFDPAGGLHVAYHDETADDLKYVHKPAGGNWAAPETLESTGDIGEDTALRVDASGTLHLVYHDYSNNRLKYLSKPAGGNWSSPAVIDTAAGWYNSMALDTTGALHLSYYATTALDLRYLTKPAGGEWSSPRTLDSAGDVGMHTSLALDASGGIHIAYHDNGNKRLKYVVKPPGNDWSSPVLVDSAGSVGSYASLAVASSGVLHVAYRDITKTDLKYAYRSLSGKWTTTTVESTGDLGHDAALLLDPSGGVRIHHHDATNKALRQVVGECR
jgi:hypothetical protein